MQLKSINEKFLPDLMQKEFGKEIFTQLENSQHIAVKGSAGSSVSIFVAELFWFRKKYSLSGR
jgi:transcription-repair coupling factor (superfamily II helicase)